MRKALGPHIFDRYVELKRKEWDEYRVQLTELGDEEVPGGSVAARCEAAAGGGPPPSAAPVLESPSAG